MEKGMKVLLAIAGLVCIGIGLALLYWLVRNVRS